MFHYKLQKNLVNVKRFKIELFIYFLVWDFFSEFKGLYRLLLNLQETLRNKKSSFGVKQLDFKNLKHLYHYIITKCYWNVLILIWFIFFVLESSKTWHRYHVSLLKILKIAKKLEESNVCCVQKLKEVFRKNYIEKNYLKAI